MTSDTWRIGDLVVHPLKPEWGPGKIVKLLPERVYVVWRDLPDRDAKQLVISAVRLAPDQQDAVLDNLPPLVEKDGKLMLPKERITFQQAVDKFHALFPQGFSDPGYIGDLKHGERHYKWEAHQYFVQHLGGDRFRNLLENDLTTLVRRRSSDVSARSTSFLEPKLRLSATHCVTKMRLGCSSQNLQTYWKPKRLQSKRLLPMQMRFAPCRLNEVEWRRGRWLQSSPPWPNPIAICS